MPYPSKPRPVGTSPACAPAASLAPAYSTPAPLLIVSPTAGGGRGARAAGGVQAALVAGGMSPIVHRSTSLADAADLVRRTDPATLVIALGGDGLIGAVAGAAAETGALLLPLAGGRGNDTVRRLGLGLDPTTTARQISQLREHRVDLGWVTTADGTAASGHAFIGVCATGFDGVANELGNEIRIPLGPLTYLAGGVLALFRFRGARYTLTADGREQSGRGWFLTVANHGQYGGGIRISPDSRINDGTLEAVGLWGGGVVRVITVFLAAFRGAHRSMRGVRFTPGREFRIEADQPLAVFADGENVGRLPASVSVRPGVLRILAGADAEALRPGTL